MLHVWKEVEKEMELSPSIRVSGPSLRIGISRKLNPKSTSINEDPAALDNTDTKEGGTLNRFEYLTNICSLIFLFAPVH